MAKVTAVWGAPDSGKTTFAVKLASTIYSEYNSTVMLVCPDMETRDPPFLRYTVIRSVSTYMVVETAS